MRIVGAIKIPYCGPSICYKALKLITSLKVGYLSLCDFNVMQSKASLCEIKTKQERSETNCLTSKLNYKTIPKLCEIKTMSCRSSKNAKANHVMQLRVSYLSLCEMNVMQSL